MKPHFHFYPLFLTALAVYPAVTFGRGAPRSHVVDRRQVNETDPQGRLIPYDLIPNNTEAALGAELRAQLVGDSAQDSCAGSWYCSHSPWFSGGVVQNDCIAAIEKYHINSLYNLYASFSVGHCTAMFKCTDIWDWNGWEIQAELYHIYKDQPCKKCGEHRITYNQEKGPNGLSCLYKLDYCHGTGCQDKGQPQLRGIGNSTLPSNGTNSTTSSNGGIAVVSASMPLISYSPVGTF